MCTCLVYYLSYESSGLIPIGIKKMNVFTDQIAKTGSRALSDVVRELTTYSEQNSDRIVACGITDPIKLWDSTVNTEVYEYYTREIKRLGKEKLRNVISDFSIPDTLKDMLYRESKPLEIGYTDIVLYNDKYPKDYNKYMSQAILNNDDFNIVISENTGKNVEQLTEEC